MRAGCGRSAVVQLGVSLPSIAVNSRESWGDWRSGEGVQEDNSR